MDYAIKTVSYSIKSINYLIVASTWPGSHKKGSSKNTVFILILLGASSGHVGEARQFVVSGKPEKRREEHQETSRGSVRAGC